MVHAKIDTAKGQSLRARPARLDRVSLTRRILDSAQSGLSKLTSLVIVDDDPLSHVDSNAFQRELAARKAFRGKRESGPNPMVSQVAATPSARAERAKAARDRAAKVHREQKARAAKQQQAADETFRRMKDQARRGAGPSSSSSSSSSYSAPKVPRVDSQVAEWYRTLDLSPGADMAQIKAAYRQLMRKYHPDVHAANPQKQKAANELATRVTTAYNGLCAALEKK